MVLKCIMRPANMDEMAFSVDPGPKVIKKFHAQLS